MHGLLPSLQSLAKNVSSRDYTWVRTKSFSGTRCDVTWVQAKDWTPAAVDMDQVILEWFQYVPSLLFFITSTLLQILCCLFIIDVQD